MSSLLQHHGAINENGVGLIFEHVKSVTPRTDGYGEAVTETDCATCGKTHAKLYEAFRKPVDMIGCWVRFRYNGETHAPDLSCPISVEKVPYGAKELDAAAAAKFWHE